MKKDFRTLITALLVSVLALAATVMKTVACFISMDYDSGFFGDSLLVRISDYLVAALIIILVATLFIKVEKRAVKPSFSGALVYLPAGVFAMSLLFLSAELLGYITVKAGGLFTELAFSDRSCVIALVAAVFALLTIAYLALTVFITEPRSILRAEFGMMAALFFALYAAFSFFRSGAPINQPQKILTEVTALAAALFMLEETRISLGKERWRGYFTLGTITAVLALYTSIPAFLVYIFREKVIASGTSELVFILALLVLSISRLAHAIKLPDGAPSRLAMAIDALGPSDEANDGEEDNFSQISIEEVADDEKAE